MPTIGWFEILIVVAIAIIVLGPKDFPVMLKKAGSWIKTVKNYFSDVQSNINQMTDLEINKNELSAKKKINKNEKKQ